MLSVDTSGIFFLYLPGTCLLNYCIPNNSNTTIKKHNLNMRKQMVREVKSLTLGHTAASLPQDSV
jgi:hypothetical protein